MESRAATRRDLGTALGVSRQRVEQLHAAYGLPPGVVTEYVGGEWWYRRSDAPGVPALADVVEGVERPAAGPWADLTPGPWAGAPALYRTLLGIAKAEGELTTKRAVAEVAAAGQVGLMCVTRLVRMGRLVKLRHGAYGPGPRIDDPWPTPAEHPGREAAVRSARAAIAAKGYAVRGDVPTQGGWASITSRPPEGLKVGRRGGRWVVVASQ